MAPMNKEIDNSRPITWDRKTRYGPDEVINGGENFISGMKETEVK